MARGLREPEETTRYPGRHVTAQIHRLRSHEDVGSAGEAQHGPLSNTRTRFIGTAASNPRPTEIR